MCRDWAKAANWLFFFGGYWNEKWNHSNCAWCALIVWEVKSFKLCMKCFDSVFLNLHWFLCVHEFGMYLRDIDNYVCLDLAKAFNFCCSFFLSFFEAVEWRSEIFQTVHDAGWKCNFKLSLSYTHSRPFWWLIIFQGHIVFRKIKWVFLVFVFFPASFLLLVGSDSNQMLMLPVYK